MKIACNYILNGSHKTWSVWWNWNWYFYTCNTGVNFRKNQDCRIPCEHSVLWFWKELQLRPKKLRNRSGKHKWINFSKHFQKRNQKLDATKFQLHALQAIHKWCCFSYMMSSCIFYIQTIRFIILVLHFNNFYFFVLIF